MCAWPSRSVLLTHTHQHALLHASFGFLPFLGALCRIGTSTRAWLFASHSHTVVRASGFRLGISAFPRYTRAVFPLPSQGLCRVWPVRSFSATWAIRRVAALPDFFVRARALTTPYVQHVFTKLNAVNSTHAVIAHWHVLLARMQDMAWDLLGAHACAREACVVAIACPSS